MPYLKGGFTVSGLPDGIPFKKPSSYGKDQVDAIMKFQDNIKFHVEPRGDSFSNSRDDGVLQGVLRKIIEENLVIEVISGRRSIKESDLEVLYTTLILVRTSLTCLPKTKKSILGLCMDFIPRKPQKLL